MVQIKLIAPAIDDIPARCKETITKSTATPACALPLDNGGYNVHPVPAPESQRVEQIKVHKDGGNNQKLRLLSLGIAISGDPMKIGTNQFP